MPPAPSSSSSSSLPLLLCLNWLSQKASGVGSFEERVICQSGSSLSWMGQREVSPSKWEVSPPEWWEVSPMCFSSLCSFIHWCFFLFVLTILLLQREQRFLLSNQAKLAWTCDLSQEIYLWSDDYAVFMAEVFRQKKLKCKILAITIAIERGVIKMCFKHYDFIISLLFCTTFYFIHLYMWYTVQMFSFVKLHVSLCSHHADSPGKLLQKRFCLHLGVSVGTGLCWKD